MIRRPRIHAGANVLKTLLAAGLLVLQAPAGAGAATPASVRTEIESLLGALLEPACQFERNGSWYSGAEARDHLRRKFDHVDARQGFPSAEQFIEGVASHSSFSGRPYQVRCGGEPAVSSQQWLKRRLEILRAEVRRARP